MRVICNKSASKKKYVATIGVFDGIHRGHQFILNKTKQKAKQTNLSSLVVTFDIPPKQFLIKKPNLLTDVKGKCRLLKALGLDYLCILKTKDSLLKLSADQFMVYIFRYFKIQTLVVGEDFRFGYKGQADVKYLEKVKAKYGFKLIVVKKISRDKRIISSSLIRDLIKKGKLSQAKNLLGRRFSLSGKVCPGRGLGKKIGFPTANISSQAYVLPPPGVYAVEIVLGNKLYLGAANIGSRPTFKGNKSKVVEVHIIKFNKNIRGKDIAIIFIKSLRNEKKFACLEELRLAIEKDIKAITAKYSIRPKKYPQLLV